MCFGTNEKKYFKENECMLNSTKEFVEEWFQMPTNACTKKFLNNHIEAMKFTFKELRWWLVSIMMYKHVVYILKWEWFFQTLYVVINFRLFKPHSLMT